MRFCSVGAAVTYDYILVSILTLTYPTSKVCSITIAMHAYVDDVLCNPNHNPNPNRHARDSRCERMPTAIYCTPARNCLTTYHKRCLLYQLSVTIIITLFTINAKLVHSSDSDFLLPIMILTRDLLTASHFTLYCVAVSKSLILT